MQSSKQDYSQLTEEERQRLRDFFELLIEADRDGKLKQDTHNGKTVGSE